MYLNAGEMHWHEQQGVPHWQLWHYIQGKKLEMKISSLTIFIAGVGKIFMDPSQDFQCSQRQCVGP